MLKGLQNKNPEEEDPRRTQTISKKWVSKPRTWRKRTHNNPTKKLSWGGGSYDQLGGCTEDQRFSSHELECSSKGLSKCQVRSKDRANEMRIMLLLGLSAGQVLLPAAGFAFSGVVLRAAASRQCNVKASATRALRSPALLSLSAQQLSPAETTNNSKCENEFM